MGSRQVLIGYNNRKEEGEEKEDPYRKHPKHPASGTKYASLTVQIEIDVKHFSTVPAGTSWYIYCTITPPQRR